MQRFSVVLIDDLEPVKEAVETIRFGLDGVSYVIDLSAQNAAKLRADLLVYQNAARRSADTKAQKRKRPKRDLGAIREWASARGETVSSRGRVPIRIVEAYEADH